MAYQWIEHTADAAVRVWGGTPEELFSEAAKALFSLITDLERVSPLRTEEVEVEGGGLEELLVEWLNELLYLHDVKGMLFCRFRPEVGDGRLKGAAEGEPFDPSRHAILTPVKAVTYHGLEVVRRGGRWEATLIFDI